MKHVEKQGFKIPKALASVALHFVRGSVKKRAKFDIFDVKPIKRAHEAFIPAYFMAAKVVDVYLLELAKCMYVCVDLVVFLGCVLSTG
mgnify:CR=1 FL=1